MTNKELLRLINSRRSIVPHNTRLQKFATGTEGDVMTQQPLVKNNVSDALKNVVSYKNELVSLQRQKEIEDTKQLLVPFLVDDYAYRAKVPIEKIREVYNNIPVVGTINNTDKTTAGGHYSPYKENSPDTSGYINIYDNKLTDIPLRQKLAHEYGHGYDDIVFGRDTDNTRYNPKNTLKRKYDSAEDAARDLGMPVQVWNDEGYKVNYLDPSGNFSEEHANQVAKDFLQGKLPGFTEEQLQSALAKDYMGYPVSEIKALLDAYFDMPGDLGKNPVGSIDIGENYRFKDKNGIYRFSPREPVVDGNISEMKEVNREIRNMISEMYGGAVGQDLDKAYNKLKKDDFVKEFEKRRFGYLAGSKDFRKWYDSLTKEQQDAWFNAIKHANMTVAQRENNLYQRMYNPVQLYAPSINQNYEMA